MVTNHITTSGFARLRNTHGFMGHAITAPICGMRDYGVGVGVELLTIGPAQGRIMPISRGNPPPKRR